MDAMHGQSDGPLARSFPESLRGQCDLMLDAVREVFNDMEARQGLPHIVPEAFYGGEAGGRMWVPRSALAYALKKHLGISLQHVAEYLGSGVNEAAKLVRTFERCASTPQWSETRDAIYARFAAHMGRCTSEPPLLAATSHTPSQPQEAEPEEPEIPEAVPEVVPKPPVEAPPPALSARAVRKDTLLHRVLSLEYDEQCLVVALRDGKSARDIGFASKPQRSERAVSEVIKGLCTLLKLKYPLGKLEHQSLQRDLKGFTPTRA